MPIASGWILDFDAQGLTREIWLEQAGGKGANLAQLTQAGMPVPRGFILSTDAYRHFVRANNLDRTIQAALSDAGGMEPGMLEAASAAIRSAFAAGRLPGEIHAAIASAYDRIAGLPVAVRSSATAEDTVEFSFAGQQDTYLNIVGEQSLIEAVVNCWGSLWTARAIGYRLHNRVPQDGLALAVVVQEMVQSQVCGVLFTANPLTGLRSQVVIDATYGLGEALVSGQVEPDQYIVDAATHTIIRKTLGVKDKMLVGLPGGGTTWTSDERASWQALPDEQILALTRLGKEVEAHYRMPQDIEWAAVDETLYLLQSRPITSLFPLPEGLPAEPLKVMVSFAAIQGLMAPVTPLGRDTFRWLFMVGARLFNIKYADNDLSVAQVAGERIWVNITTLLRNTVGRKVVQGALGFVEPTVKKALMEILDDPRLQPDRAGISWKARRQIAHFALPLAGNVLLNLIAPAARRAAIVEGGEKLLVEMQQEFLQVHGTGRERLKQTAALFPIFISARLRKTFLRFVSGVASGMAMLNALNGLARSLGDKTGEPSGRTHLNRALEITRGLPNNPTTEMDLSLWQVAKAIRQDAASLSVFQSNSAADLAGLWSGQALPPAAAGAVQDFLHQYGGRGLAEIDLGRVRWREDPKPVFEALAGYLKIDDPSQAPDAVFKRGETSAKAALDTLVSELRQTPRGWIKAAAARFAAGRMRRLLGIRESPKFFAVRMFGLVRSELLVCGRQMAAAGELAQAEDLFFLSYRELEELAAAADLQVWRELISQRRRAFDMEQNRRQIPRMLLSDGRAFYEGIQVEESAGNILFGSPVSPGSVEGRVRVVLDPHHAGLLPGEIMVCPGTDPSWTPLFLSCGGLIMETGGMMTHGAVVAREYGIPAVVGVDRATLRFITGARIRLDGSTGQIVVLEEEMQGEPEESSGENKDGHKDSMVSLNNS